MKIKSGQGFQGHCSRFLCKFITATVGVIHNVPALAKGKVPHKYVERGLRAFSPLYLRTRAFVYISLQSN